MKILILSWRGPKHPNAGGAEVSTFEHAKSWVKAGYDVTLFTSAFAGCKEQEVIDGIKIKRCGRQIFGVQWEAFKWYLFGEHPKFDLVIDQFHGIPFFTPIYIKEKKLAFIHEVTKEVWRLNPWSWPFNRIAAFIGEICEPLVFKLLYKEMPFMTVSQSTKQDLVDWGIPKSNITVIHNGINIPRTKKFPPKEKKKTAIFLGSISKDKGIEDAIYIFKEIDNIEKGWQFWVVGKSDMRYLNTIQRLAKNLGIFHKIIFWGYVTESKKFELLSKAHILVNPSIREGWGLVVIEAGGVGTPTAGYNVAGLRNSVINGKTGLLSHPHNITALAIKIVKLMNNKLRLRKMSLDAYFWSKKFRWENACWESLKLVESVVSEKY
ncbi:glycosyltransferase family 4 protein [Candidatus Daviesbacteria bacterium]|nr:glycosyltransferase family 4 protein [Candidatus Daviesbacteria bacterium]